MRVGVVGRRVTVFVHKGVGHKLTKGRDKPSVKLSKVEVTFPRTVTFLACPLELFLHRLSTNLRLVGNSGRGGSGDNLSSGGQILFLLLCVLPHQAGLSQRQLFAIAVLRQVHNSRGAVTERCVNGCVGVTDER